MTLTALMMIASASCSTGEGRGPQAKTGITVHAYTPFEVPDSGIAGTYPAHVRSDLLSTRFDVRVEDTEVAAVRYDNTGFGDRGHNVDVARFASDTLSPLIKINLISGDDIADVTIHPVCFYPTEAITVGDDGKSLSFRMDERLPYAIVAINGGDPQDACDTAPQLVLINDPLENPDTRPRPTDSNVLDFGSFAADYLRAHPNTDSIGAVCRKAGSVTDTSLNDGRLFTWNHDKGRYVDYTNRQVAFPDKRARDGNDLTDALQAALQEIRLNPELNTLYIGPGVYLWSGLRIIDWNGDSLTGGKPLYVYTNEDALMVNRLKECREALEPAIFIRNSSHVTISGRGMHDAQGCYTFTTDRKDARNTPHQGGVVVMNSDNITFNDTYMRDSQQWNYETHDSRHIAFNNIKGLSPYNHGWIDGLNFSSGQDITVNRSLTLGNDDTFATGHYNPSNEFPVRTYNENKSINLDNTDANPAEIRNTFAAAGIYNRDRLKWSTRDSWNIRVNNAMGWTRTAHCIRAGSNLGPGPMVLGDNRSGASLKSYYFNNFHSVVGRNADGLIRFQNGNCPDWPSFEEIEITDCSFWTPATKWLLLTSAPANANLIKKVTLRNNVIVNPIANPAVEISGVEELTIDSLYIGGTRVTSPAQAGFSAESARVTTLTTDFN